MLYCDIFYYTYCVILYYTILYYNILYYTMLYYTVLYPTILYCTLLHCIILYYTVLYHTILYHVIRYYIILYYTIRRSAPATARSHPAAARPRGAGVWDGHAPQRGVRGQSSPGSLNYSANRVIPLHAEASLAGNQSRHFAKLPKDRQQH